MRKNSSSNLSMAKSGGKQLFATSLLVAFTLCNSWLHAQDADWQNEDPADVLADVLTEATQAAVVASNNAPSNTKASLATNAPPPVENPV